MCWNEEQRNNQQPIKHNQLTKHIKKSIFDRSCINIIVGGDAIIDTIGGTLVQTSGSEAKSDWPFFVALVSNWKQTFSNSIFICIALLTTDVHYMA